MGSPSNFSNIKLRFMNIKLRFVNIKLRFVNIKLRFHPRLRPARLQLYRPKPILIAIVPIRLLYRQNRVGIASPAAAKVEAFVNPADAVFP